MTGPARPPFGRDSIVEYDGHEAAVIRVVDREHRLVYLYDEHREVTVHVDELTRREWLDVAAYPARNGEPGHVTVYDMTDGGEECATTVTTFEAPDGANLDTVLVEHGFARVEPWRDTSGYWSRSSGARAVRIPYVPDATD